MIWTRRNASHSIANSSGRNLTQLPVLKPRAGASETRGTVAFYAVQRALNAFCFSRHTKQVTSDSFRDINIILMSAYRHFIGRFPDGNFNGLLAGQAFDALTTASPVGNIVFWNASVQPITGNARDETIADDHPKR
jgi:hypothetical protein